MAVFVAVALHVCVRTHFYGFCFASCADLQKTQILPPQHFPLHSKCSWIALYDTHLLAAAPPFSACPFLPSGVLHSETALADHKLHHQYATEGMMSVK